MALFSSTKHFLVFILVTAPVQSTTPFDCLAGILCVRCTAGCLQRNMFSWCMPCIPQTCVPTGDRKISKVMEFTTKKSDGSPQEPEAATQQIEEFLERNFPDNFDVADPTTAAQKFLPPGVTTVADLPKARAHNMALTREEARKLFFGGSGTGFPGTATLARASLRTYGNTAHNPKSYLTFFHGTGVDAIPWMKEFGLRPGAADVSDASCVYCTTNLNTAGCFSSRSQKQVQYPAPPTTAETAGKEAETAAGEAVEEHDLARKTVYRTSIVMARVRPGSDAVVRNEGFMGKGLRRAWTQSGDSLKSGFGLFKYDHPQLCAGDDMARWLCGNPWGDDVVGLYPHVYGKTALAQKGFEVWFLEFEADQYNTPLQPKRHS